MPEQSRSDFRSFSFDMDDTELIGRKGTVSSEYSVDDRLKEKKKCCTINKDLLGFKLNYFLFAGVAAVYPYIAVIVKDKIQLSASAFGMIVAIRLFFSVSIKIVIGYVVDYHNNLKTMIIALTLTQWTSYSMLLYVATAPRGRAHNCVGIVENNRYNSSHLSQHMCERFDDSLMTLPPALFDNNNSTVSPSCVKESYDCNSEMPDDHLYLEGTYLMKYYNACSHTKGSLYQMCSESILQLTREFKNNCTPSINLEFSTKLANMSCEDDIVDYLECKYIIYSDHGCFLFLQNIEEDENKKNENSNHKNEAHSSRYFLWCFGLAYITFGVCYSVLRTLIDTACIEVVEKMEADYGQQMQWGPIGWALFATFGGFLNDFTYSYISSCGVFGVISVMMIWNTAKLNLTKPQFPMNIRKNMREIIRLKEFVYFNIGVLLSGIGFGIVSFYLVWFVRSIGGSHLVCGLVDGIQSFAGEVPFFFFSGSILKKLGYFNTVTLTLVVYTFRFFWYSRLFIPWLVLPFEWTHGITYAVFYTAIASFAKKSSMLGTEATTQAVIFATFDSLGAGIGNILAGVGFDYIGGHETFFYLGLIFASFSLFSIMLSYFNYKKVDAFSLREMNSCDP